MSAVKEPAFFAFADRPRYRMASGRKMSFPFVSEAKYLRLFAAAGPRQLVGESSTLYLFESGTAERIHAKLPEARIVVVFREPVERAYSAYGYLRRNGQEPLADFGAALEDEEDRQRAGYSPDYYYRARSRYPVQIEPYLRLFGRERTHVVLFDGLQADFGGVVAGIQRFLGIAPAEPPEAVRRNASAIPRSSAHAGLRRFVTGPHPVKSLLKPVVPATLRRRLSTAAMHRLGGAGLEKVPPLPAPLAERLAEEFRPQVETLSRVVARSLSGWLERESRPAEEDQTRE